MRRSFGNPMTGWYNFAVISVPFVITCLPGFLLGILTEAFIITCIAELLVFSTVPVLSKK